MSEYAEVLAGAERGAWRQALARTQQLLTEAGYQWLPQYGSLPSRDALFGATALLVLGLAHEHDVPAAEVSGGLLSAWLRLDLVPADDPARPAGARADALAALLRAAGHPVPDPAPDGRGFAPADPVVAEWDRQTRWTASPDWYAFDVLSDARPGPLIGEGFRRLLELIDPAEFLRRQAAAAGRARRARGDGPRSGAR